MENIKILLEQFQQMAEDIRILKQGIEDSKSKSIKSEVLTSQQVQEILGISPKTWQKYRDENMIGFSQIGQKIYVKYSDILEFLERYKISPY